MLQIKSKTVVGIIMEQWENPKWEGSRSGDCLFSSSWVNWGKSKSQLQFFKINTWPARKQRD